MVRYVLAGLIGAAIALYGVLNYILWLIPVGIALIFAAFVWFARSQTSAPVEAPDDNSSRRH